MAFANPHITAVRGGSHRVPRPRAALSRDRRAEDGRERRDRDSRRAAAGRVRRRRRSRSFYRRRASQKSSPKPDHAANAIHSARVKLPGHAGNDLHQDDRRADHRADATPIVGRLVRGTASRRAAARGRRAHADSQPTPTASEPTSVIGTRIASPNIAAAAVSTPISVIATTGVPIRRVHAAERRVHEIAPPDRVEHARRRHEVAVEDLQQRQERAEQDQLRDRVRAERPLERHFGARRGPTTICCHGYDVGDDRDDDHVEEQRRRRARVDRLREVARIEARLAPPPIPWRPTRTRSCSTGRSAAPGKSTATRRRRPACENSGCMLARVAAREAEHGEDRERRQQAERHHVLEHAARLDAAVVDERR